MITLILCFMLTWASGPNYRDRSRVSDAYLIELNHRYDDKGQYMESQIIWWTLCDEYGDSAYRTLEPTRRDRISHGTYKVSRDHKVHRFVGGTYRTFITDENYGFGTSVRELRSEVMKETHTTFDPSFYQHTVKRYKREVK